MDEKKPIVCPCGKLLGYTTNSKPTSGGTKVCPSCKRRIKYEPSTTKVYTSYVK